MIIILIKKKVVNIVNMFFIITQLCFRKFEVRNSQIIQAETFNFSPKDIQFLQKVKVSVNFNILPTRCSFAGYKPSNAFDNNRDTLWVANGAAPPGMQWIAYEFPHPVFVGSIRIVAEEDKPERSPSMIYVEVELLALQSSPILHFSFLLRNTTRSPCFHNHSLVKTETNV